MFRSSRTLVMRAIAIVFLLAAAWGGSLAPAHGADAGFNPALRPEFKEPVTLASKDGILEVRLTAHQGHATLDTVAGPVQNFLIFGYQVLRGTASSGALSGDN